MTQPWHRQVGEPARWYQRFLAYYLPQGPDRTIEQAFRLWTEDSTRIGKGQRPGRGWIDEAREWEWIERATAWDVATAEKAMAKVEKEQIDMIERHARFGLNLQAAALKKLEQIVGDPANGDPGQWDTLSPMQMLALLDKGVAMERQARGLPDQSIDMTSKGKSIKAVSIVEVMQPDELDEPDPDDASELETPEDPLVP